MKFPNVTSGWRLVRWPSGALFAIVAVLVLAGCEISTPSGSSPAGSIAPSSLGPPGSASPTSFAPPPAMSSGAIAADATLLGFVPSAGLTLTYDPDTTARVAADPTLATSASSLAIALAMPIAGSSPRPSSAAGADLAVVSVIRLRDPSFDETWFRDWRDSYDESACANAGGVTRRAETDIRGRTVFVGSCAGGSFTYHVRIDGGAIVIALTSIGPSRIGQTIMEGLGP